MDRWSRILDIGAPWYTEENEECVYDSDQEYKVDTVVHSCIPFC